MKMIHEYQEKTPIYSSARADRVINHLGDAETYDLFHRTTGEVGSLAFYENRQTGTVTGKLSLYERIDGETRTRRTTAHASGYGYNKLQHVLTEMANNLKIDYKDYYVIPASARSLPGITVEQPDTYAELLKEKNND